MKRRIVLLGPPASGKGTQSDLIQQKLGIRVTSTGAILREEAKYGTALGREIKAIIASGSFAPDDLVMQVVAAWIDLCGDSFGFDGFPRTLPQAIGFERLLDRRRQPLQLALFIDVSESTVVQRMASRLTCRNCGKAVTLGHQLRRKSDPCPNCGGVLEVRADDNCEALATRLAEFRKKTVPVTDFYFERGILTVINGDRDVDQVFADVQRAIVDDSD